MNASGRVVEDVIRVLVADDHPLMREGIGAVIGAGADMKVVAEAANGIEAVAQYEIHRPHVTLMDVQMPEMDGMTALARIKSQWPPARILMLTTFRGDVTALKALKQGAAGYLLKNLVRTELLDAVRAVHGGQRYIPREVAAALALHVTDDPLSDREQQVLAHVAAGLSNKRVAHEMGLAEDTVKSHMKSLMLKLSATDRTHAVTIALARGLIDLPRER